MRAFLSMRMNEILRKNIEALAVNSPETAREVMAARGEPAGIEFSYTKQGLPTARRVSPSGETLQIHSRFDPIAESLKFVGKISPGFGRWSLFLAPGLWYEVRALKARMSRNPMLVVETDVEMLRATLERVKLDDLFSSPGFYVVAGGPEKVEKVIAGKQIRIRSPRDIVTFKGAAHCDPAAYSRILDAIHRTASKIQPAADQENVVRAEAFGRICPADMRVLVTSDDRYSDAVKDTLTPRGVDVKNIFDIEDADTAAAFRPSFIFAFTSNLMQWPDMFDICTHVKKKTGAPLVVWNMEDPVYFNDEKKRALIIDIAKCSDLFYTQNAQFIHLYRDEGADAKYLPTAAKPDMRGDPPAADAPELDFSFFGAPHAGRDGFFDKLIPKLADMKYRIVGPGLPVSEYVELARNTKVNLTVMTGPDIALGSTWSLSDRVWEIPYAGGFILQDHRKHTDDHFAPDEAATFTDLDDCAEKIRYYVAHPEERARILSAARLRIRREHLWAHRMEKILADLQE